MANIQIYLHVLFFIHYFPFSYANVTLVLKKVHSKTRLKTVYIKTHELTVQTNGCEVLLLKSF